VLIVQKTPSKHAFRAFKSTIYDRVKFIKQKNCQKKFYNIFVGKNYFENPKKLNCFKNVDSSQSEGFLLYTFRHRLVNLLFYKNLNEQ
jgi:hypothetical protein